MLFIYIFGEIFLLSKIADFGVPIGGVVSYETVYAYVSFTDNASVIQKNVIDVDITLQDVFY